MAESTELSRLIDEVAHLLPAQGPISVFIHHNTLHAFEHLPFERAVVTAGRQLGCEPFLSEESYRDAIGRGRITESDVEAVLTSLLGDRADEVIAPSVTRLTLRRRVVTLGIPEARGEALSWVLGETAVLRRFRDDLPDDVRLAALERSGSLAQEVERLWSACERAVERASAASIRPQRVLHRHRDFIQRAIGLDIDEWIHPVLIRFVSAYLDQGLAHWQMTGRERGMYACFVELYASSLSRWCGRFGKELTGVVREDRAHDRTSLGSLHESLVALGVPPTEWGAFLGDTVLSLRGWAGMVRQIEERPDRVPARPVPARLDDFIAVRLLLERAALAHAARVHRLSDGPLSTLRERLRPRVSLPTPATQRERAWVLFHVAQLCGLDASALAALDPTAIDAIERDLSEFDGDERRLALHLAYERQFRHRFYDALAQQPPGPPPGPEHLQAIFCLDEREESFRRHLEEVDPGVETLGAAGFFGVAMYYRGAADAHPRPLCPVAIQPQHFVGETREDEHGLRARWRQLRHRGLGLLDKNIHLGSRTLVRGSIVMAALGALAIVPLVLRVLFPWLSQRIAHPSLPMITPPRSQLRLDREDTPPPIGANAGFTIDERAAIVREQLENVGIAGSLAPLVLVVGHGSVSLNNPHESAHDCGACGGGRGGPNARAFAQMANDPRVRARLAEQGLVVPVETFFVGAERNTASNAVTFFDTPAVPETHAQRFENACDSFDRARRREAHERCRRFEVVPGWFPTAAALLHVEARAADLAQPRPEYGHATNAMCVIGRRSRTKGLFFDRRAFLVSYDSARDPEGEILERLLAAVLPVISGISLEYYFGYVDPSGYGSGTKLPHNVTCLLGVMDGAQSDLRTGLPWQMLEIHEPMRVAIVVECSRDALTRALRAAPSLARLVDNRWIFVACLDPEHGALWELTDGSFERYRPEHPLTARADDSASYYRGKRGHLAIARISEPVVDEPAR